jgi:dimethylamine corrinoid protein
VPSERQSGTTENLPERQSAVAENPFHQLRCVRAARMVRNPGMQRLIATLTDGDSAAALAEAQRLRDAGVPVERIVNEGLETAMEQVDAKCTVEAFNLLEIMLVGRAVTVVANELYPWGMPPDRSKATVVIATPEGDVHDLGKNIVTMVLTGKGYRVVDLGRNCPVSALSEAVEREQAAAVLLSGLLTTVIPQVRRVRPALAERGLFDVKILAGGAALRQASTEELDVDYVAQTAFDGARLLESCLAERPA